MSRTLIVFYSRTGTGRQAAQQLHELTQWPIAEVRDLHPRTGLAGTLRCMVDSLLALPANFMYEGPDLNNFDRLVLVTPVWLGLMAAPLRGYLSEQFRDSDQARPHLSLVCLTSKRSSPRVAAEAGTYAGHTPTPVMTMSRNEVRSGSGVAALRALANSVQDLDTWPAVRRPRWLAPKAV
jgi:hypothetical protein